MKPHMYWLVEDITAVSFGDREVEDGAYSLLKHGPQGYMAIFDTGTSMTMIPSEVFEPFIAKLRKHSAANVTLTYD